MRLVSLLVLTGCYNRTLYEERFAALQPDPACEIGLWYLDVDGDGFGGQAVAACEAPGQVTVGGDCDDGDPAIHPDAFETSCNGVDDDCDPTTPDAVDADDDGFDACTDCDDADPMRSPAIPERCNGIDDDCDGSVDQGAVDAPVAFLDEDGDGIGALPIVACDADQQGVPAAGDCNDLDPTIFPGATEDCDPVDRDCDGHPTAGTPVAVLPVWYEDADGDGLGNGAPVQACEPLLSYVALDGDCDDADASIGAARTWYVDDDLDGYGTDGFEDCLPVAGRIQVGGDCDDTDPAIHPDAIEQPADGRDSDCDGSEACFEDLDGDGWGGALVPGPLDCEGIGGDCDDDAPAVNPGAVEVAGDGVDVNCDGDDRCFRDLDGDGWGAGNPVPCTGATGPLGDCDDDLASVHPHAPEIVGDSIDQDCDGVDACYVDADGDGFGLGSAVPAVADCALDASWARLPGDCAPSNGDQFPGAPETVGDGVDQDCDGRESCYPDNDGDGVGAAPAVPVDAMFCTGAYTTIAGDCADGDPTRRPGAPEVAGDGIDQDCDGLDQCYLDADGDGYGAIAIPALACVGDLTAQDDDCDDTSAAVHPDAIEVPVDGIDNDCDSIELCYLDTDGDHFGTSVTVASPNLSCDDPNEAPADGDCAPDDPTVYPGLSLERRVPDVYPTLAEAVQASCASDRVVVARGVYTESFAIDTDLQLIGEAADNTQIVGRITMSQGSLEQLTVREGVGLEGGCVFSTGPVDLVDVVLEACAAETGGGAWLADGSTWMGGTAQLNTALTGGAAWLDGDVRVERVRFVGNDADEGAALAGTAENELVRVQVLANTGASAVDLDRAVFDGVVVAGNEGDGVVATVFDGAYVTVAGNGGDGLVLAGASRAHHLLVSHNQGVGVRWSGPQASPFDDSWVYGNDLGPVVGLSPFLGHDGVEAIEPLYILFPTTLPVADWELHLRNAAPFGAHAGPSAIDPTYYADGDLDGLFDGYELTCMLDPLFDDSTADPDGDLLTNAEELLAGTRADRADTDGDGVDDLTEITLGTDPRSAP